MPAGKIYLIEMRLHHALNPKPNYPTYIPKNYSQNLHLFGNNSNDNIKKGSLVTNPKYYKDGLFTLAASTFTQDILICLVDEQGRTLGFSAKSINNEVHCSFFFLYRPIPTLIFLAAPWTAARKGYSAFSHSLSSKENFLIIQQYL